MRERGVLAAAAALAALPAAASIEAWGPETNLSSTPTDSETGLNHSAMARTPDGTLHVVWAEKDGPNQNYQIWTRRLGGGTWSPRERIVEWLPGDPGTNGGAKYPALAALPDGSLHLFWHDYRVAGIANVEIFTKERPAGAAWDPSRTADVRLTTTDHPETNGDNGYVPVPVAASDGTLHVLWYDFRYDGLHAEILSKTRPAGGAWDLRPGDSADVRVSHDGDHSELAAAAVDAAGDVHAAWRSAGSGVRILYARRDAATGSWSAPIPVDGAAAAAGAPAIAADPAGRVHVVWPDGREGGRALWTRVRAPDGSWSAEERLTRPADGADEPSLAVAPDGTLHLVWHDGRVSLLNREIFHREKTAGAPWDTSYASDTRISDGPGASVRPSVLADAEGVAVLWKDARDGNHEIYFRRGGPAGTAAPPPRRGGPALLVRPSPARGGPIRIERRDGAPLGEIAILDVAGRRVRHLAATGSRVLWDGRSAAGEPVPSGVYFVRAGRARARVTVRR